MAHRLFIGLRPPEDVRDRLIDAMEDIRDARWQSDDQLHVTLRFIGELARPDANALAEALTSVGGSPFPVEIDGVGYFERKNVPRAVWARVVPAAPLSVLKKKIDRVCRALSHADDPRKYMPHITMARLNTSSGPIEPFLMAQAALRPPVFIADRFTLFESHLSRAGSYYEPVADYPLAPSGAD